MVMVCLRNAMLALLLGPFVFGGEKSEANLHQFQSTAVSHGTADDSQTFLVPNPRVRNNRLDVIVVAKRSEASGFGCTVVAQFQITRPVYIRDFNSVRD
jgi:hypothetical protein